MEELKRSWLIILVTAILSILGSLLIMSLTFKRENTKEIEKKIDDKINKVEYYSDRETTYKYINQQDNSILLQLQKYSDEDEKREKLIIMWLESIDRKVSK